MAIWLIRNKSEQNWISKNCTGFSSFGGVLEFGGVLTTTGFGNTKQFKIGKVQRSDRRGGSSDQKG